MTSATNTEWGPLRAPSYCTLWSKTPQVVLHIFEKQLSPPQHLDAASKKNKTGPGPIMALSHATVLEILAAEQAATDGGPDVAAEPALTVAELEAWMAADQTWENAATWEHQVSTSPYEWEQSACSEDAYDVPMWSNLSTPSLSAAKDAYEVSMWSDMSTPELSPASDHLPWPLPLPLDAALPWAALSPTASLQSSPAEFLLSTPEPSTKSAENGCSWTPPKMRANAVEFVPAVPATFPNSPSNKSGSLSPRSTLLTMSGAWGALCRNSAISGAIAQEPAISKDTLVRCRAACRTAPPPDWLCGGPIRCVQCAELSTEAVGSSKEEAVNPQSKQVQDEENVGVNVPAPLSDTTTCCSDSKETCATV